MLLPPSGGRLVLATAGAWQVGGRVDGILRSAPIRTAAGEVVRAVSTSSRSDVDASAIVADIMTAGATWHASSCPSVEPQPQQQREVLSRSRSLLGLLGRSRSRSSPSLAHAAAAADAPSAACPPAPVVLADYDTAALLGLTPRHGSERGMRLRRSRSWSSFGSSAAEAAADSQPVQRGTPLWFGQQAEAAMRALLVSKAVGLCLHCKQIRVERKG